MFEPFPLGHRGGPGSDRHGVIERHPTLATSATTLDPGDCATHGAVAQHGAQVPCALTVSSRGSPRPIGRAGLTRSSTSWRTCCVRRRRNHASRSGRSSSCTLIWSPSATTAPTIAWRPSRASGRPRGIGSNRPVVAARSCRWRSCPAKRSSSTGRSADSDEGARL